MIKGKRVPARDAMRSLRARLLHRNPNVQMLAIKVHPHRRGPSARCSWRMRASRTPASTSCSSWPAASSSTRSPGWRATPYAPGRPAAAASL